MEEIVNDKKGLIWRRIVANIFRHSHFSSVKCTKNWFFSGRFIDGHKNDGKISSLLIFAMFFIISKKIPSNDNQVTCICMHTIFQSGLTEKLRTLFSWKVCRFDLTEKRTQSDDFFF